MTMKKTVVLFGAGINERAQNEETAKHPWVETEKLIRLQFDLPTKPSPV